MKARFLSVRMSLLALTCLISTMPAGCASKKIAVDHVAPYAGPEVSLRPMAGRTIAVFTVPTGGWGVRFDRTEAAYKQTHVFVTLTTPDPTLTVTQDRKSVV